MTDRLHLVLAALRTHFTIDDDVDDLTRFLAARGLARHEIDEVLTRFVADAGSRAVRATPRLRVPGPHELGRFAPDAWGHLLALQQAGAVSAAGFEMLVERALLHIDGVVSLADVRALADEAGVDVAALSADHTLLH
jgi:uncharacterized protein Smg (DUF494 family)